MYEEFRMQRPLKSAQHQIGNIGADSVHRHEENSTQTFPTEVEYGEWGDGEL